MDVSEEFKLEVSEKFLVAMSTALRQAYQSAYGAVMRQELGDDEIYNALPWTRRAHVEARFRDAALACGLEVTREETGFWRHVVVTCGRFKITQSTTFDAETPLRKAGYKLRLAQEQLQFPEFEEWPTVASNDTEPHLYAVIIHRGIVTGTEPNFMAIRFPKPDLDGFHEGMIDLTLYSQPSALVEEIETEVIPKLKGKRALRNG